jgi:hypothetical protein
VGVFYPSIIPEQIYIIIVFCGIGSLGVDGQLRDLWTVGGVGFAWVARERGELGLVGGDMLVPAVGIGVLLNGGGALGGLEDFNVGLRGTVSEDSSVFVPDNRTHGCVGRGSEISVARVRDGSQHSLVS